MRDDIFKRVAVPRSIRTWMRARASNEADAISGRSRAKRSRQFVVHHSQTRALQSSFQSALRDAAKESEPLLPGIGLHWAIMASDSEGPLGDRVASEISRRAAMDRSLSARQIVVKSLEAAASSHLDGYGREFESHVQPDRDPVARKTLQQLRRDIEDVGLKKFAEATIRDDGLRSRRLERPTLSLDENLLVEGQHGLGVQP